MENIKPLGLQILVEPDPADNTTQSGIIIPDMAKDKNKPNRGTVIACGEIVKNVKPGDRVIYGKYSGVEIESGEKKLLIIKEQDLFGLLES